MTIYKVLRKLINEDKYLYALFVVLIYCGIYLPVVLRGKMYIYLDIGADTYSSYWPMYAFAKDFFQSGTLTGWSFQQGLGANNAFLIPWVFDPYNLLMLPFSKYNLDFGIFVALTAKVISLAVLAFAYMKRLGFSGVPLILSSLAYTYSGFFVGWGQHYQFATMFILFTFVMLGLEIWLQASKKFWLILSVALLAAYWPYALFMTLVSLPVFYVFRYVNLFKFNWRCFWFHAMNTAWIILVGIALTSVSFLPQVYVLSHASRVSGNILPIPWPTSAIEALTIFTRFFSNGLLGVSYYYGYQNYYESPFLYTGVLTVFMGLLLFIHQVKKPKLVLPFFVVIFLLLFPSFINPMFGAFSVYTYRWTFVLVPVFAVALGKGFSLIDTNVHPWIYGISTLLGLTTVAVSLAVNHPAEPIVQYFNPIVSSAIVFIFSITYGSFLFFSKITGALKSYILLMLFVCELTLTGFVTVNLRGLVPTSFKDQTPFFEASTNQALEMISSQDSSFYRINKHYDYIGLTDSLFQGFYGEKQYSSVIPAQIWRLQEVFRLPAPGSNYFFGLDGAQQLRDISVVKYMLAKQQHDYAGYQYIDTMGNVSVYENKNALPLGIVFYDTISLSDFEQLNPSEQQYILYDAVIVPDDYAQSSSLNMITSPTLRDGDAIGVNPKIRMRKKFIAENEFPEHLIFTSNAKANSALNIEFLQPTESSVGVIFSLVSPNSTTGKLCYKTLNIEFNEDDCILFHVKADRHEYYLTIPVVGIDALNIEFPGAVGYFGLDNFEVRLRNDEEISEQSDALAFSKADIQAFKDNYIKARVNLVERGVAYFSIPFDDGWQVYVDGDVSEKILTDIAFIGVPLDRGEHTVELRYFTPWMREGAIISTLALCLILAFFVLQKVGNPQRKLIDKFVYFSKKHPDLSLFAATTAAFTLYGILFSHKIFYYDAQNYWELRVTFLDAQGKISLLNYSHTLRAYLFPLILFIVDEIIPQIFADYIVVALFNSLVMATLSIILIPAIVSSVSSFSLIWYQKAIIAIVIFIFWRGYLLYPLSDFPALLAMLAAAYFLVVLDKGDKNSLMILRALIVGIFSGVAYLIRPVYLASLLIFVLGILYKVMVLYRAKRPSITIVLSLLGFVIGVVLIFTPQYLINRYNLNLNSPLVSQGLYSQQISAGLSFQKAESNINIETYDAKDESNPCAGIYGPLHVRFIDQQGMNILKHEGDIVTHGDFDIKWIINLFVKYPLDMVSIYFRHVFNGLNVTYPTPYISNMYNLATFGMFINFSLIFSVLFLFKLKNARIYTSSFLVVVLACLMPVIASIPTVIELRFFLPLHMVNYTIFALYLEKPGDTWKSLIKDKAALIRLILIYLIFIAACFSLASSVVTSMPNSIALLNR